MLAGRTDVLLPLVFYCNSAPCKSGILSVPVCSSKFPYLVLLKPLLLSFHAMAHTLSPQSESPSAETVSAYNVDAGGLKVLCIRSHLCRFEHLLDTLDATHAGELLQNVGSRMHTLAASKALEPVMVSCHWTRACLVHTHFSLGRTVCKL